MKTALLFIVFNKPDTTKKVFESIKNAKPQKLYIACDGPRNGNLEDINKINNVKKIIENIDWECKVFKLYRNKNLGCRFACIEAIDWFFENEEEGIIVEDDTLPRISFYEFCEKMLETYKEKKVVMHIGGFKPIHVGRDAFSISFTRATHVWGWATWRDRWNLYKKEIINEEKLKILHQYEYFQDQRKSKQRVNILQKVSKGTINSWAYQWNYTVRSNSGLAIRPCVNLVDNLGIEHEDATNTTKKIKLPNSEEIDLENLLLPPWIIPNRTLEKQFEKKL